jgi:AcrR family transcriptional regulator
MPVKQKCTCRFTYEVGVVMKVRTEARREAIVEAAALLFQEVGYERASMNELTKRLGGSKATLYGYFPSKESLFVEVVRSVATVHLSEAVAQLAGPDARTSACCFTRPGPASVMRCCRPGWPKP